MKKYRHLQTEISAVQFRADRPWPAGVIAGKFYCSDKNDGEKCALHQATHLKRPPVIMTEDGPLAVRDGQWVIKNALGDFSIMTNEMFTELYEEAS